MANLLKKIGKSLLHQTAVKLRLQYWQGEPPRIDGVFLPEDESPWYTFPLPVVVAIEHENKHGEFGQEIAKLFSLRCPLKVGIVYSLMLSERTDPKTHKKRLQSIRDRILHVHKRIISKVGEDPKTEYLFLVGVEAPERHLTWHSLQFSADQIRAISDVPPFSETEAPATLHD